MPHTPGIISLFASLPRNHQWYFEANFYPINYRYYICASKIRIECNNNTVTEFQALLVSPCKHRVEGMTASVVMDAVAHDTVQ